MPHLSSPSLTPRQVSSSFGRGGVTRMWSSFTIAIPDPPAVVRDRLAAALTTAPSGLLGGATTFDGSVSDAGFRVVRNPASMGATLPIVAAGRFEPSDGGTAVYVTTRPQWWVV